MDENRRSDRIRGRREQTLLHDFERLTVQTPSEYHRLRICRCNSTNFGVFAEKPIRAGETVCEYRGDILEGVESIEAAYQREEARKAFHYYIFEYSYRGKKYAIDASVSNVFTEPARSINHSGLRANSQSSLIRVGGVPRIFLVAICDIGRGHEILYDYSWVRSLTLVITTYLFQILCYRYAPIWCS